MPTFPLRTIECADIVLVPQNENNLVAEIRRVANPRQQRTLVPGIEKSIKSIRHKLSVAMYQAALICDIKPDDFDHFERLENSNQRPQRTSPAEYKGCIYNFEDIHHYRLLMTLFVETFAAANFSLLDVVGHLINNLYDLGKTEEKTSFRIAFEDLYKRKKLNPDAVYTLLSNYRLKIDPNGPDNPNVVSWFNPLRTVRNRTTHQLITDVCEAQTLHRRSLYDDGHIRITEFILNSDLFPANTPDTKLRDFVQEVFEGMQGFIEDLYDDLTQAVISSGSLPLS